MDITVIDVPEQERFEARDETGQMTGYLAYQVTGSIAAYVHTEVKPEFEGKGIGSQLARAAMDDARAKGRTVVPICPYLLQWLDKHAEYEGIVARDTKKVK